MTHKHYKAIAEIVAQCTTVDKKCIDKDMFVAILSAELYKANSLFDKGKFYDDCNKDNDKDNDKDKVRSV